MTVRGGVGRCHLEWLHDLFDKLGSLDADRLRAYSLAIDLNTRGTGELDRVRDDLRAWHAGAAAARELQARLRQIDRAGDNLSAAARQRKSRADRHVAVAIKYNALC